MIEDVLVFVFGPVVSWLVVLPVVILAVIWGISRIRLKYERDYDRRRDDRLNYR